MKKCILFFFLICFVTIGNGQHRRIKKHKHKVTKTTNVKKGFDKDSIEKAKIVTLQNTVFQDTVKIEKLKFYKKGAHASYYANKFNGKRTASGKTFDNDKYTAAHKNFPFGTKLKITNEANGKSVIVEVTDRGPFVRGREIDLTRRAFMEITSNKGGGEVIVKIEEIVK